MNFLKQRYRFLTANYDISRLESVLSQEIMSIVEKESGLEISGGVERAKSDSSSIHISFTEENARCVEHENEDFRGVGIKSELLDRDNSNGTKRRMG